MMEGEGRGGEGREGGGEGLRRTTTNTEWGVHGWSVRQQTN